jgi:hypothetical protein
MIPLTTSLIGASLALVCGLWYYDHSTSFRQARLNFYTHDLIQRYLNETKSPSSVDQVNRRRRRYKAFLVGATGAVGKCLLLELLHSQNCERVVTLTRRPIELENKENFAQKLKQIVVDDEDKFMNTDYIASLVTPEIENFDVAFSSFGTTRRSAGGARQFERIDRDMNIFFGDMAYNKAHIPNYSLVSSIGANRNSMFLYPRCKGEIEYALEQMAQKTDSNNKKRELSIFRPSVLITQRPREYRPGEPLAQWLFQAINPILIAQLREYRAIRVEDVAKAMRIEFESRWMYSSEQQKATRPSIFLYSNDRIHLIANELRDVN